MLSDSFTKENLDTYLKELAKAYKKVNGKSMPAEIILIGGAAILANYGFRNMTTDIDAIIHTASSMKEAVNYVGDKFNLPNGWLNADFMHTASYSPKLNEFSIYYKSFYGVLSVRAVAAEYLIAMKLRAGRKYKNDLSDIIGILAEHKKQGREITFEMVEKAVENLYGDWKDISEDSKTFIENVFNNSDFESIYASVKAQEIADKEILLEFNETYPEVVKESNASEIIKLLKEKQSQESI